MSSSPLASECPGKDLQGVLKRLVAGVERDIRALPERPEDRVHDIRVRMKKFRAVLRLAESGLTKQSFLKADKMARTLKDHFGSARDQDVQRELLLDLLEKKEAIEAAAAIGLSKKDHKTLDHQEPSARELCGNLAALVSRFDLQGLTREDLLSAWTGSYRNSCRAMRACRKGRKDDFLFHEWRKRVKEFLYQSLAIGAPCDSFASRADKLSSVLGSHHDLSILSGRLAEHLPSSKAERAALLQKKIVARRALAQGRKIFSEKPSVVLRRTKKL
ncbi:MAG: CHAD domain-containing protein [Terrimicrobiaceae bacterium]